MKTILSFIFSLAVVFTVSAQKGIGLEGRIFSSDNHTPVAGQKVFVVFESSAQPYVQNLNNMIHTAADGSFSFYAPNIPSSIIPLDVMVYTYDCDFQRKGYLLTYNQNNVMGDDIDISICMGPINMPAHPLQLAPSDNSCPAYFKAQVNDSLKRKYLLEEYIWTINNNVVGHDQAYTALLLDPTSNIKVTQIFTDSITGFVFDSIQINKALNLPPSDFHIVGGTVFSGSYPTTTGDAVLLGRSNNNYFSIDTCHYSQYGYFYFASVPRCNYTVRITEADNSMTSSAIPTYLGSGIRWEAADFISPCDDYFNANITLTGQLSNSGICDISGYVIAPDPSGYDALLYTDNMTPFSFRHCGTDGYFHFTGIPYGNYFVVSEKFGVASVSQSVSLSMSNPTAYVSLNTITQLEESETSEFSVFPNPAEDFLKLSAAPESEIHILTIDGKEVMTVNSTDGMIDIRQLSAGMYFLQTSLDGQPVTIQFVVFR